MKLTIQTAHNGFIVNDGECTTVFRYEDPNSKEDKESLQEMLYTVIESLGVTQSKHNNYRLSIEIINQKDND